MAGMTRRFGLLARIARIDVIFDKGIDTWKPVVLGYQFESLGDTRMLCEGCIMMFSQYIHARRFQYVDEALVKQ